MRIGMGAFLYRTNTVFDRQLVLTSLGTAQIELVHGGKAFRCLRIEILRKTAEEFLDGCRLHAGVGLVTAANSGTSWNWCWSARRRIAWKTPPQSSDRSLYN